MALMATQAIGAVAIMATQDTEAPWLAAMHAVQFAADTTVAMSTVFTAAGDSTLADITVEVTGRLKTLKLV